MSISDHWELHTAQIGVLRRYMNLAGIDANSNLPLFRPLVFHMSNTSYTLRDGKISYTSCREILRGTLERRSRNHLSNANCRNHEVCDVYLIYECLLNYPVQDSEIPNWETVCDLCFCSNANEMILQFHTLCIIIIQICIAGKTTRRSDWGIVHKSPLYLTARLRICLVLMLATFWECSIYYIFVHL